MRSALVALLFASALVSSSGRAAAQTEQGGGDMTDGVDPLKAASFELELHASELAKQLQAGDCATACAALASMQRAADRICDLEPGPRCEGARRDVEDARQRVSAACPDCALAQRDGRETTVSEKPDDEPEAVDREESEDVTTVTPAAGMAPPAEDARGGCAACAVGDPYEGDALASGWLALGVGLLLARRRLRAPGRARGTSSRRS